MHFNGFLYKGLMMNNKRRLGNCKQCGDLEYISKRKLCTDCSTNNMLDQQKQLKHKKGQEYDKWKKALRKSS